jgi:hypothetical protein
MELEFDKEIDAILRKARSGTAAGLGTLKGSHLDADTIAAFAENALPQASKLLYMEHLADCDRCRKQLSHAVLMTSEADATAASSVSGKISEPVIPWYQKLFTTPNLAIAMGALVLTFSGVLGYLVLQNRESGNATVSQVTEQEPRRGGPFAGDDAGAANSNAAIAANTASNVAAPAANAPLTANSAANSTVSGIGFGSGAPATAAGRSQLSDIPAVTSETGVTAGHEEAKAAAEPAPPPPAPPVTMDGIMGGVDKKKDEDERENKAESDDLELAKRKRAETRSMARRDLPPPAAKSGPARSGPLQSQSKQVNSNIFDMSVTRGVGGNKINNRNGVWYDSAYHGQATINYRRDTEDYKKLDRGLRNIADTLGGTVVVVWQSKAYRIQ